MSLDSLLYPISLNSSMFFCFAFETMSTYGFIALKFLCPVHFMTIVGEMPNESAFVTNVFLGV